MAHDGDPESGFHGYADTLGWVVRTQLRIAGLIASIAIGAGAGYGLAEAFDYKPPFLGALFGGAASIPLLLWLRKQKSVYED